MTKTTNQPPYKFIANVAPDGQKAFWVEYGAAWPTKSDPRNLAVKLHSLPTDPNATLLLVVNEPKDTEAKQEMAV
ncbi:MAG: hypothetical protein AAFR74_05510 [Pseudomonadota bacterium]